MHILVLILGLPFYPLHLDFAGEKHVEDLAVNGSSSELLNFGNVQLGVGEMV